MGSGALDELPVILVVEDEPLIQSLVEEALGMEVLSLPSPHQAKRR
jgi:CheY-like chemotaxis protein